MRRLSRPILLLLALLLPIGTAQAVDFPLTGVVDVYSDLTVTEVTQMDFGIVLDRDGAVTLTLADAIVDGGNGVAAGGATIASGDYQISGETGQVVDLSLVSANGATGLALANFTVDAGAGATTFPTSGTLAGGNLNLVLGADLTVTAAQAASGQNQALSFTIGVAYQ